MFADANQGADKALYLKMAGESYRSTNVKGLESYYNPAANFQAENWDHMSYSLNSLKGVIKGLYNIGEYYRGFLRGILGV